DVLCERAEQGRYGEAHDADDEEPLAAETIRQPADRGGHDRCGDDVGGQHPVDLVERGRQRALHVGQRHVGNCRVERLHDGRGQGSNRDQDEPQLRLHRKEVGGHFASFACTDIKGRRLWPVSISTVTLIPERSRCVSSFLSKAIRTGTRCTTFTQLPVAFCGGSIANSAPVPGLTETTVPVNARSGKLSTSMVAFWPTRK